MWHVRFRSVLTMALLAGFLVSCEEEKKADMLVTGNVKGLKKGTLYLQRVKDSSLVVSDSVVIDGNSEFILGASVDRPEIFYLYLNKKDGDSLNDRILFFGEKGTVDIRTTLNRFELDAKVTGSNSHDLLAEYNALMRRFNNDNLDQIEARFKAQQEGDSLAMDSLTKRSERMLRLRYLTAVNFALNHKDSEVAPYIAVAEIYDANPKLLDTIYTSLTPEVRASTYGQALGDHLKGLE